MSGRRWLRGLVAVGVLMPVGCRGLGVGPSTSETSSPVVASVEPPPSQFAELIRRPGQRVATHPSAATPAPAATVSTPGEPRTMTVPTTLPASTPVATSPASSGTPTGPTVGAWVDPPLVAALRDCLANRPEAAADQLRSIPRTNRELTVQLLQLSQRVSVANLSGAPGPRLNARDAHELSRQLDEVQSRLAQVTPLTIEKALFTNEIRGFGQYTPTPKGAVRFAPGQVAEIYAEFRHAVRVPLPGPDEQGPVHCIHVEYTLKLLDADNRPVEIPSSKGIPQRSLVGKRESCSNSVVNDHFVAVRFLVPNTPGRYSASLEFRDVNRVNPPASFESMILQFSVVADPTALGGASGVGVGMLPTPPLPRDAQRR